MMLKNMILIMLILSVIPLVIGADKAADLTVVQLEKNPVILSELDNNATFKIKITNNEAYTDEFQIYSLIGATIYPKDFFTIKSGESITLDVVIAPHKEIRRDQRGTYAFEYQIKGKRSGYFKDTFSIKIFDVKDVLDVAVDNLALNSPDAKIIIQNTQNAYVQSLQVIAKSKFFEFSQVVDLGPEEKKSFTTPIILQKQIPAGTYPVEISYKFNDRKSDEETSMKYLEEGGISVSESSEGFIIKKTIITKTNEGNIKNTAHIEAKRNILTRLVTIFSDRPTSAERKGLFMNYAWEKELGVGEKYTITITTNYTIPFMLILLIIVVALFTQFMITKKVSVKKRVSLIRTKGGEFALKVIIRVKARKNVQNVIVTDRIPGHSKLYDKFGIKPHRIDESTRRIEWDLSHLSAGEERVFTYVIYSKINIVGTFELPSASVSYVCGNIKDQIFSNKTYFSAETSEK